MASFWCALGRSCVRATEAKGLIGNYPGSLTRPFNLACASLHTGVHHSSLVSHTTEKVFDEDDYRKIRFIGKQKELLAMQEHFGADSIDRNEGIMRKVPVYLIITDFIEVNEQFAINLISEQPINETDSRIVSCDGGGGALGHPKVYINLDKETKTGTCGYCGLQFKQKHHH